MVYTAFAICEMLNDWSGVDVPSAVGFIKRCIVSIGSECFFENRIYPRNYLISHTSNLQTYEGGFGQAPGNEATGALLPSRFPCSRLALPTMLATLHAYSTPHPISLHWLQ